MVLVGLGEPCGVTGTPAGRNALTYTTALPQSLTSQVSNVLSRTIRSSTPIPSDHMPRLAPVSICTAAPWFR